MSFAKRYTPTTYQRFEYTAVGGETSFTGADDNSNVLDYDPNTVLLLLNGVILNDGDATYTDGANITGLAALTAGDKFEVIAIGDSGNPIASYGKAAADAKFELAGAGYSKAAADAKFELIGTGKLVGIKSVTVATLTSTTGTTYVDATGVTLDYAQVAAGNYCLVTCFGTMLGASSSPTQIRPWVTLLRDGATLASQSFNIIGTLAGGNLNSTFSGAIQAYVSAGDTALSTYKLQIKCQDATASTTAYWGIGISGNSTTVLSIMEFEV